MSHASRSSRQAQGIWTGSVTIDPGSAAANSSLDVAVAVGGIKLGDIVTMNIPASLEDDLLFKGARVSDAEEITVTLYNPTGAPIDGASLVWTFGVIQGGG